MNVAADQVQFDLHLVPFPERVSESTTGSRVLQLGPRDDSLVRLLMGGCANQGIRQSIRYIESSVLRVQSSPRANAASLRAK